MVSHFREVNYCTRYATVWIFKVSAAFPRRLSVNCFRSGDNRISYRSSFAEIVTCTSSSSSQSSILLPFRVSQRVPLHCLIHCLKYVLWKPLSPLTREAISEKSITGNDRKLYSLLVNFCFSTSIDSWEIRPRSCEFHEACLQVTRPSWDNYGQMNFALVSMRVWSCTVETISP